MNRWRRWKPRNSSLWRTSTAFWLLNAAFNSVTASVARTPSVYLALSGINLFLAGLSYFVSCQYRQAELSLSMLNSERQSSTASRPTSDLNAD